MRDSRYPKPRIAVRAYRDRRDHNLLLMAIFAPKKCARLFDHVETRLKVTFHSPAENPRATRRLREPLSKTPLLFFHNENAFPKKGKTISIQTDPNLIISRREALLMSRLRKQLNHQCGLPRNCPTDGSTNPRIAQKSRNSPASSVGPPCHPWVYLRRSVTPGLLSRDCPSWLKMPS
jgi:hypothetical protein